MARSRDLGEHTALTLTKLEARALHRAAGECLRFGDVAANVLPDGRERAAAYRAWDALRWVEVERPSDQ